MLNADVADAIGQQQVQELDVNAIKEEVVRLIMAQGPQHETLLNPSGDPSEFKIGNSVGNVVRLIDDTANRDCADSYPMLDMFRTPIQTTADQLREYNYQTNETPKGVTGA